MKMPKTASQANFAQTVHANIQRSTFLRPSSLKTTFNCGDLVPIYIDEVLPGDTRVIDLRMLSRLSTPLFPTMDNIRLDIYAFYVPNRLVWKGWEQLNGENKTGAWVQNPEPALVPQFDSHRVDTGDLDIPSKSIGDYYGLPVGLNLGLCPVSALPFRGYALIWNEWFRDENLQAPKIIYDGNSEPQGIVDISDYHPSQSLFKVNKFHDYFTSALPAPQKGDSPLIPIELNKLIPVITGENHFTGGENVRLRSTGSQDLIAGNHLLSMAIGQGGAKTGELQVATAQVEESPYHYGVDVQNLWADPRAVKFDAGLISQLRTNFQILKLFEKDARGGTRYVEMLKAHFGVDAGDYRLQNPEFLGHFGTLIGIQAVPQTSASSDNSTPQGNLAAYSLTTGRGNVVRKTFVEHGFIHIFAVARQVKTYQQGVERFWFRSERFDFYLPTLAHISEQPIMTKEIYALPDGNNDYPGDTVFGYQEAWADYRYKPNRVSGQMRSGVANSLDAWHYADIYESAPVLSSEWIVDNSAVNVNRTLAVSMTKDDQIRADFEFLDKATRPMPVYSIPGLVDHF